jgi:hypothetical protein
MGGKNELRVVIQLYLLASGKIKKFNMGFKPLYIFEKLNE